MVEVFHSGGDPCVTMRRFLESVGDEGLASLREVMHDVMSTRAAC